MDIRELRYFVATFETGSLTAAARRCYISQPSISGALAALEAELGVTLFIRHKKGVSPTSSAEQLYPRARNMIDEATALSGLFREAPVRTQLRLGLMRTLDIARTVALLAPLTAAGDLSLALVEAEADCDARIISRAQARPEEVFTLLWREPYVLALPANHPLRFKDEIKSADLAKIDLIDRCHCENADQIQLLGFRPRVVATATSEDWALALVRSGLGGAIMPRGAVPPGAEVIVRGLADFKTEREVGLAYSAAPRPEIGRLIATLRAAHLLEAAA